MTSLYGKYIKERENCDIIEHESGFISYRIRDTQLGLTLFIEDIFVLPEKRRQGIAAEFCELIKSIAKKENCKQIMSGADPTTLNATESVAFQISMGSKIIGVSNGMINFYYKV